MSSFSGRTEAKSWFFTSSDDHFFNLCDDKVLRLNCLITRSATKSPCRYITVTDLCKKWDYGSLKYKFKLIFEFLAALQMPISDWVGELWRGVAGCGNGAAVYRS
jgi:hypothetical protein